MPTVSCSVTEKMSHSILFGYFVSLWLIMRKIGFCRDSLLWKHWFFSARKWTSESLDFCYFCGLVCLFVTGYCSVRKIMSVMQGVRENAFRYSTYKAITISRRLIVKMRHFRLPRNPTSVGLIEQTSMRPRDTVHYGKLTTQLNRRLAVIVRVETGGTVVVEGLIRKGRVITGRCKSCKWIY